MRVARFAVGNEVRYGVVANSDQVAANGHAAGLGDAEPAVAELVVAEIAGHPFGPSTEDVKLTGAHHPLADVRLLAPVLPSKIVAIGRNYEEHAR